MKTLLPRRTLLSSGLAAAALFTLKSPLRADPAQLAEACMLVPEQALGPYYLADELVRSDIREGKTGVPLELIIQVLDVGSCRPIADAAVDLWHCDAAGAYSGFGATASQSHSFLRGIQITDHDGLARFQTIFPGCYPGRTNHIHFKVRTAGAREGNTYRGGHTAHTGQVFFPEEITVGLMQHSAYGRQGERMRQDEDGIFQHQNGRASTARLTPVAADDPGRGFQAVLAAAIDVSHA